MDEYQKLLAEKRKNLIVVKSKGREIDVAKEFKSMQPLSIKKGDNEISSKVDSSFSSQNRPCTWLLCANLFVALSRLLTKTVER